jgi:hypothetical protein
MLLEGRKQPRTPERFLMQISARRWTGGEGASGLLPSRECLDICCWAELPNANTWLGCAERAYLQATEVSHSLLSGVLNSRTAQCESKVFFPR